MNRTNNRVESINQKLKSVISRYSGITPFFQDLMKCLNTLRVERDHRALEITMKRRVSTYDPSTAPYSFEYVKDQLEQASKVQIVQQLDGGKSCSVRSRGQSITSTIDSCPCGFISAMQLPGKHILAVRTSHSLPEYDESLCAKRWKFDISSATIVPTCQMTHVVVMRVISISQHTSLNLRLLYYLSNRNTEKRSN